MQNKLSYSLHDYLHKKVCHFLMEGFTFSSSYPQINTVLPDVTPDSSPEKKASQVLSQMTIEEKIDILSGYKVFAIKGNKRLNLPEAWTTDATSGIRYIGESTVHPSALAMASTWNIPLIKEVGGSIAKECSAKGISILLAPGVNIARVPTCGRNFEYMGEDPFLASEVASSYIKGVQENGIIATIKHFACNNSEYDRHRMDAIVDERTLHEIYLPAFKKCVTEAKVKAVMSAYNPVNGIWASENKHLLTDVLRNQWGFKGIVMSDWQGTYSAEKSIKAGLDLEMPSDKFYKTAKILSLIKKNKLTEDDINQRAFNILYTFFEAGVYSKKEAAPQDVVRSDRHLETALNVAKEGVVLCKNENNILPLSNKITRNIAVIGENGIDTPTSGGGAAYIKAKNKISIVQGLKEYCNVEYIKDNKGKLSKIDEDIIKKQDAVIICAGFNDLLERECHDRTWELPFNQSKLIKRISKLNDNCIVILTSGGDVETQSWINDIKGFLHTFYLGEKAGEAIASIIFGETNPSGKLPFTMAKQWKDHSGVNNYVKNPGKANFMRMAGPQGVRWLRKKKPVKYKEGIMVGYRHFDTKNIEPQFPFGYGLSYTKFELSNLNLSSKELYEDKTLTISLDIKNTGEIPGAEVVQLYVSQNNAKVKRPEKELKNFRKIFLTPGETKKVSFTITPEDDLSYYDINSQSWIYDKDKFTISIGTDSRNLILKDSFVLV